MKTQLSKNLVVTDSYSNIMNSFRLSITGYGNVKTNNAVSESERFDDLYRINYLTKGKVIYHSENKEFIIEENSIIVLLPGTTIEPYKNNTIELMFINFDILNINRVDLFIKMLNESLPSKYLKDNSYEFRDLMHRIFNELNNKETGYLFMAVANFYELFIQIQRKTNQKDMVVEIEDAKYGIDIFDLAVNYVYKNTADGIKVKKMAEDLGISEIYLYKLFIEHSGVSTNEFIIRHKMELAKTFLLNPSNSIKEISSRLGFQNQNYFSNSFKKRMGVSPKEYRKQMIKR